MPNIIAAICQAIDEQNVNKLRGLLTDNPHIDLNHITQSGLSALWWALTPPRGKLPSFKIISTLIATNRIDPTQCYKDSYLQDYCFDESPIRSIILQSQTQYEQRQFLSLQNNKGELATLAADKQNTHDTKIVKAVNNAIAALYKRYVNPSTETRLPWEDTFTAWASSDEIAFLFVDLDLAAANQAIKRVQQDPATYPYILSEQETIHLTNAQVLMLVWQALQDKDPSHFVFGIDMSEHQTLMRKKRLLQHLIQSQKEYPTTHACWMGTRNQIISCLDMTHIDIRIADKIPVTPESIGQQHAAFCRSQLKTLSEIHPSLFWNYLYYYPLRGYPGGCATEAIPPNDLQIWLQKVHNDFISHIHIENNKLETDLQMPAQQLDSLLLCLQNPQEETYPSLNHSQFSSLLRLNKLLWLINTESITTLLGTSCTHLTSKTQHVLKTARFQQRTLDETLDQLVETFFTPFDAKRLTHWLSHNKNYAAFLKTLDEQTKMKWLKTHWPVLITYLQQSNACSAESNWLEQQLCSDVKAACPTLAIWLDTLPSTLQQRFLYDLIDKKWHLSYQSHLQDIKKYAFIMALQSAYLSHITLDFPLRLKNKDLRGINLSQIDLKNIHFNNCDLRLTGLARNKTLKARHLNTNTIDPNWLSAAIATHNLSATAAFLESTHCSASLLLKKEQNGKNVLHQTTAKKVPDHIGIAILNTPHCTTVMAEEKNRYGNNVLHEMIIDNRWELFAALLEKTWCTQTLLGKTNNKGYTPLHLTAFRWANSRLKTMQMILDHRQCTPDLLAIQDKEGNNPLHTAIEYANVEAIHAILASPHCTFTVLTAKNKKGETPLDTAIGYNDSKTAQTIIAHQHYPPSFSSPLANPSTLQRRHNKHHSLILGFFHSKRERGNSEERGKLINELSQRQIVTQLNY